MNSPSLRIALAQINPIVGDIEGNAGKIIAAARRARDEFDAALVVYTELALTGYPPEDLLLRSDMYPRVEAGLDRIRRSISDVSLIVGAPLRENGNTYNAAVVLHADGTQRDYYKAELPNYGVFDEKRHFSAGTQALVCDFGGVRVGVTICEDIWFSKVVENSRAAGAQVIVSLNASPFDLDNQRQREIEARARVRECGLPLLYVNQVGGQDEIVFDGHSLAMDKRGNNVLRLPQFEEALGAITVSADGELGNSSGHVDDPGDKLAVIYKALVCGVRDYVDKNGFAGVVIGLSGGIDSALTLAVAFDALGAERVQAVMMPFDYTAQMSKEDAALQAKILGVKYSVIPIAPAYKAFVELLRDEFAGFAADTTEENIQARCRGLILMAISNKKGSIVLTTGNKSEMAVGYATLYGATLYGDMAGGFAPLKDVPKTTVFELAEYCNRAAGAVVIPQRVIDRPPSAELAPGQIDRDSLPPYEVLDAILRHYIEEDWSIDKIVDSGFDREMVVRIVKMVVRNEYKRRQAPPGVRVSKRAFGRDRRYPITSRYEASTRSVSSARSSRSILR